jgi:hypothetical protein
MHNDRAILRGYPHVLGAEGITPNPRYPVSLLDRHGDTPLQCPYIPSAVPQLTRHFAANPAGRT